MKFTQSFIAVGLFTGALALPTEDMQSRQDAALVDLAQLTFAGGEESFPLNVTTDGMTVLTESNLVVEFIDTPTYNAQQQCNFITSGDAEFQLETDDETGGQRLLVNPPQVISAVSCEGTCVPTYGECYDSNGQPVGSCCAGFCAATRCRPWNIQNMRL